MNWRASSMMMAGKYIPGERIKGLIQRKRFRLVTKWFHTYSGPCTRSDSCGYNVLKYIKSDSRLRSVFLWCNTFTKYLPTCLKHEESYVLETVLYLSRTLIPSLYAWPEGICDGSD